MTALAMKAHVLTPTHILFMRHGLQMQRVYTKPVSAFMVDL